MDPLKAAAREAWIYGLPLIEMAAQRSAAALRNGLNAFSHRRTLSGPKNRGVTAPNNDTLFSSAFLDLSRGPLLLKIPKAGERYISVALMDMYTNNFAVLGTRTLRGEGGEITIVGPHEVASAGAIRSPTPWAWALCRTLVDGDADLPAAHAVQDSLDIRGLEAKTPVSHPSRHATWDQYFSAMQALLLENLPPTLDRPLLHQIAPLGLGPGQRFQPSRFNGAQVDAIIDGVKEARRIVRTGFLQHVVKGWAYPGEALGDFGDEYLFRAAVALTGLAALPRYEAMYMQAVDSEGSEILRDNGDCRLHFAAGAFPPAGAFWSITMYEVTAEGQFFLTENPIDRYSIGDRTPGLSFNDDGSLDIWIGSLDPGRHKRSNWLPAPAAGPHRISLRAYLPEPSLLSGAYRLPSLVRNPD